jgi:hypothetical protein
VDKTDEDVIVSPLLVKILGLKTPALVLERAELTNMTEKEDGNGERNSHVWRSVKNKSASCKVIYEEEQELFSDNLSLYSIWKFHSSFTCPETCKLILWKYVLSDQGHLNSLGELDSHKGQQNLGEA